MMDAAKRIEQILTRAIAEGMVAQGPECGPGCPPRLAAAMRYGVFPGGARLRPRLCLAVAGACGEDLPELTDAAAAAIEFLHCASLIHDDLPCFDDAATRRGKASVHRAYGEHIAVLAGDALIVLAFQVVAAAGVAAPQRLARLVPIIAGSVGIPSGIASGQAWECEPDVALPAYQQMKTGALFAAATMAGAAAAGMPAAPWRVLGARLGEAYQVADDIRDVAGSAAELGKPVGRDAALGRPSAAREFGIDGAIDRLEGLVVEAVDSVPDCPGASLLRAAIRIEAERFLPKELRRAA